MIKQCNLLVWYPANCEFLFWVHTCTHMILKYYSKYCQPDCQVWLVQCNDCTLTKSFVYQIMNIVVYLQRDILILSVQEALLISYTYFAVFLMLNHVSMIYLVKSKDSILNWFGIDSQPWTERELILWGWIELE